VNYANDYSDGVRGTDTDRRGPVRLVASGLASPAAVKRAAGLSFLLAAVVGLVLALVVNPWLLLVGVAAVAAAVLYTGGPKPYGYLGLGELMVLAFFGFVAVAGTVFVQAGAVPSMAWLAAVPVGCLATNILVVNNVRDVETDIAAGKRTLPARFGRRFGVIEYWLLLGVSYSVPFLPELARVSFGAGWLPCLTLPLALHLGARVARDRGAALNPILARTALLMFVFGLLFGVSILLGGAPSRAAS
jgi:1,4-dihydroxy-2-naphthoate octaprenyltransferase